MNRALSAHIASITSLDFVGIGGFLSLAEYQKWFHEAKVGDASENGENFLRENSLALCGMSFEATTLIGCPEIAG